VRATYTDEEHTDRPRPRIHFTANDGWINDPYGITWADDHYDLYYQAVPGRVTWGPNCHWGHAQSPDLVRWSERELALVPQPDEVGCWSGSVVHDIDPPVIFYTRVDGDDWELGKVATAVPEAGTGRWSTAGRPVVVDQPPAGLGVLCFRDPFVFRHAEGWTMLMAAALEGGTAAVLHYRSADLRTWTYDGILCSRGSERTDSVWTGSLWECPQLFRLEKDWVLLVSVWDAGALHYVAASIGDYDGHRFHPRSWQRLTYGNSAYAMAAFLDRDGSRCVMSWLREEPQNNEALTERAGAHSIASTVELDPTGALVLSPHPDIDALRGPVLSGHVTGAGQVRYDASGVLDIEMRPQPGLTVTVTDHGQSRASFTVGPQGQIVIERPGFAPERLAIPASDRGVRLLLDADIAEVFTGGSYGAYRLPPTCPSPASFLEITTDDAAAPPQVTVRRIVRG
jgi:beta-fructofuranosidase